MENNINNIIMTAKPPEQQPTPEVQPMPTAPSQQILRQQELQQELQALHKEIVDMQQQKHLLENMIQNATVAAAEVRGRLKETQRAEHGMG